MFLEGCERGILGFLLTLLSCQPCVFWPSNVPSSRHDARNFSKVVQKAYFHNQHGSHDRMQSLTWILLKSTAMVEDQWKRIWSSNGRAQWWYDQRFQDEQRHGSRHEYGSWQERGDPRRDRSRSCEKTQWHWGADSREAPACPADGSSWRDNIWSEKKATSGGGSNWGSSGGQEWSPQQASNSARSVPPPPPRPPAEWSRIDEGRYWEPSWGQEWSTPPAANSAGSVPPPPPRPPAEWSRSEQGRNWGSSWGQEWSTPPAANSAGSVPPPPPRPPAEWSRSEEGRNWGSSWGREWSAPPASNSGGSLPHPPVRPPAEWSASDGGFFWQTGSPPPVDNLEGIFPSPPGLSPAEQSTSEFSEPEPEYKEEDRGCWHAKRGDGKRNPRAEKAISLSSGQNESETRICFKALPTRDNSICPVVQQLMVIIGKVIRRADGDSMFSTANMICFFCREVRVQNYLRILEGTVFRFTGHVDGSGDVLEILATTLGLQRQKETGSYQKWVRDGGGLQLCHWSLDNFEKDGNAMHQSFQRVFMQSHQHSIFILEGKTLHRVEGFEHFINCSVHFLPFPEEEMTECSIAVRTTTSARKQAFWILLHVLCRNLFPSMEFREQLSAMASHPMHFKE